jgi:CHAT domain-containing protein
MPVEKLISDKKTIYLLPDGVFHLINIGALQNRIDSYLMDQHDFITLSSVSDFKAGRISKSNGPSQAVLFGNPRFNLTTNSSTALSSSEARNNSIELSKLPGTNVEVRAINELLREHRWSTKLYTDANATESNLKSKCSANVLLISTHGFYGGGARLVPDLETESQRAGSTPDYSNSLVKPMLNSGLYLAGAQNSLNVKERPLFGKDDGILTSYEISSLAFDNLNLVVLSSCESGLGKVNSEGVYGLQRAFREAGADNVLISLWDIDDNASQLFIRKFMEYYLTDNTVHKALKQAQLYLRNQTVYKHPYYWASFVCVGIDQEPKTNLFGKPFLVYLSGCILLSFIMLIFWFLRRKRNVLSKYFQK